MLKFVLVISFLIVICAATEDVFYSEKYIPYSHTPAANLYNGSYFPKLDHFRPQDTRTVEFHYRLNLDHYQAGGPLFIYVNDGGLTATTEWIEEGLVVDVAREVHGALITTDHRYIGLNIPTETAEFDDFAFLTVEQAVADIATLVATLHDHLGTSNPRVILWGVGYGAALATFARKKYPHLIHGVFASSGTFRAEVFDTSYIDNLSYNLQQHGSANCHDRVENAFDILDYLFQAGEVEYIQERLSLCNVLDAENPQEEGFLFERFVDLLSGYIRRFHLYGIETFCRDMLYYPNDPLNSMLRWALYVYGAGDNQCFNTHYPTFIQQLSSTSWNETSNPGARAKSYLRCTQLAAFRLASDFDQTVFPPVLDLEYHFKSCEDIFGEQYNRDALLPAVQNLNIQFGGQGQVVPFVIFTNAGLDPWIGHGVSDYDQEEGAVIFIYYSAAGRDLTSISLSDPVELYRAKQQISETLVRWSTRAYWLP